MKMASPREEVARLVRMSLAFHSLNKRAEQRLGLSLVQYHLLVGLRDMPGCSPQALSEVVGMHPSTLTQSLKRLVRKGAVFVGPDSRDSRKKMVTLTRNGQELISGFERGAAGLMEGQLDQDRIGVLTR